mgnify:CR=1 FL=1
MAITKVLARHWTVEVQTGEDATTGDPIWTRVNGLTSIGFSSSKNDADTTDFDSEGVQTHLPASRGYELTLEGQMLEDQDTGERDEGQQFLEELSYKIGPDGLGNFRLTSPGGNMREFQGSVNIEGPSGGNDDPTAWNVTVRVSGKPTVTPAGGGGAA